MAGTDIMTVAGSNFRAEHVVLFYGAGLPINIHGLFMSGSNNLLNDFQVNGTPRMVNPLNLTGNNNLFQNCIFLGGDGGGAGPGSVIAGTSNRFTDVAFTSDGVNTVSGNTNHFLRTSFTELSALTACVTNTGTGNIFADGGITGGFGGNCLIANGPGQQYHRVTVASGGGTAIAVGAFALSRFVDCAADGAFTTANLATDVIITRQRQANATTMTLAGQGCKLIDCILFNLTLAATATDTWDVNSTTTGAITDTAGRLQQGVFVHQAAGAPTVNDDINDGYLIGISRWFDTRAAPLGQIEYRCHSNAAGAAVWIPIGTAGIYSVLIHPTVGVGQYTTISAFCTAEVAGTIAGIAPGTYTEVGNIAFKAGQQVFGLGGVDSTALKSVLYQMGSYTLTNNTNTKVDGVYFTHTVAAPDPQCVFLNGASGWVVRNCTFDFTPSGAFDHLGIIYSGTGWKIQDVNILCNARTYRAIYNNGATDGVMENVKVTGGMTTVAGGHEYLVRLLNSQRNRYTNVTVTTPSATVQTGALMGVSSAAAKDPDQFQNIQLVHGANNAASGNGLYYFDTAGAEVAYGDEWGNLSIKNFYVGARFVRAGRLKFCVGDIGTAAAPCGDSSIVGTTAGTNVTFSNMYGVSTGTTMVVDGFTALKLSGCDLPTISLGPAVAVASTIMQGCSVTTLTNGAFSTGLNLAAVAVAPANFTDSGHDTVRDQYTSQTYAVGPVTVRGSREYNNAGAGVAVTFNLPDPAAVTVSIGYEVRFVALAAQQIIVKAPALNTIYSGFVSSTVAGTIYSDSGIAFTISIRYVAASTWVATAQLGQWITT
jgi:hypothetical protein